MFLAYGGAVQIWSFQFLQENGVEDMQWPLSQSACADAAVMTLACTSDDYGQPKALTNVRVCVGRTSLPASDAVSLTSSPFNSSASDGTSSAGSAAPPLLASSGLNMSDCTCTKAKAYVELSAVKSLLAFPSALHAWV